MVSPRDFRDRGKKTTPKSFNGGNRYSNIDNDSDSSDSDKDGGAILYSPAARKAKLATRRNISAPGSTGLAPLNPPVKEHTGGVSLREHNGGVSPMEPTGGASLKEAAAGAPLASPAESSFSESSDTTTLNGSEDSAPADTNTQPEQHPVVPDNKQHPTAVESQPKNESMTANSSKEQNGSMIANSVRYPRHIGGGPYRQARTINTRPNAGVKTAGQSVAGAGHSVTYNLPPYGHAVNQAFYGASISTETPPATKLTNSTDNLDDPEVYGGMNMNVYPQYAARPAFTQLQGAGQDVPNLAMQTMQPFQQQTGQIYVYNPVVASPAPSTVINTEMTPKAVVTPPSQTGTPTKGGPVVQSEPHNFAPRVKGTIYDQPPPQFKAQTTAAIANGTIAGPVNGPEDPFNVLSPGKQRAALPALASVKEQDEAVCGTLVPVSIAVSPKTRAEVRAQRSDHLNRLTDGPVGLPTAEEALNPANFPFMETSSQYEPTQNGVVHIANIPFSTKLCEIVALFGRNAKIDNDVNEPVHIIMERTTSKTQDAYVEFVSVGDAMRSVERMDAAIKRGRLPRLGDRPVTVTLSSQCSLMKDLFPLAKGVMWRGQHPQILEPVEGEPWKEFKGFITEEEMTMLEKHVEIPHRSPYSKECPQRPFESLISIIKKMPWHMSHLITIRQRYAVYHATYKLLELLILKIKHHREKVLPPGKKFQEDPILNEQLKKRLVRAAMLCPGFSVLQKDNIACLAEMPEIQERGFNQPRFSEKWTHELAICPKPGVPLDVLEWYIAIIREESTRFFCQRPIKERSEMEALAKAVEYNYFGHLWSEIGYPSGPDYDNMTLRDAAMKELSAIERVLKRALPTSKD